MENQTNTASKVVISTFYFVANREKKGGGGSSRKTAVPKSLIFYDKCAIVKRRHQRQREKS